MEIQAGTLILPASCGYSFPVSLVTHSHPGGPSLEPLRTGDLGVVTHGGLGFCLFARSHGRRRAPGLRESGSASGGTSEGLTDGVPGLDRLLQRRGGISLGS